MDWNNNSLGPRIVHWLATLSLPQYVFSWFFVPPRIRRTRSEQVKQRKSTRRFHVSPTHTRLLDKRIPIGNQRKTISLLVRPPSPGKSHICCGPRIQREICHQSLALSLWIISWNRITAVHPFNKVDSLSDPPTLNGRTGISRVSNHCPRPLTHPPACPTIGALVINRSMWTIQIALINKWNQYPKSTGLMSSGWQSDRGSGWKESLARKCSDK